jgi:hypothetical protein
MILYQVFKNKTLVADKVKIEEARSMLPAGCKIITVKNKNSHELKDIFQVPCNGGTYTIIQIPQ